MSDLQAYLDKMLKEVQLTPTENKLELEEYDIYQEISDLITTTRNQLAITQKELSTRSGVSQANISRIENGSYHPSISVLKRIADGLGKRLIIEFADSEEVL
jgi:ribosome-binding protein aMBF1 (putative translation factor)